MMELRMTTDLETALPAEIGFNFNELKTELEERLHHYNTMVVTEDTIKEGKADLANLRKLKDAIETRRKEVKRQCEQPYKVFESRVRELTALIDAPISAIDGQLKRYEEERKAEKRGQISLAYATIIPEDLMDIIPLGRIFNPKWENASTTMKTVEDDLLTIKKRTYADLLALDTVDEKYAGAVRAKYIETLDVGESMRHMESLKAADKAFQQREESRSTVPKTEEKPPVAYQEPVRQYPSPNPSGSERLHLLRLEFHITQSQANALKQFLVDNKIQFEKIK